MSRILRLILNSCHSSPQSRPHEPMNLIPRVLATEGRLRRGATLPCAWGCSGAIQSGSGAAAAPRRRTPRCTRCRWPSASSLSSLLSARYGFGLLRRARAGRTLSSLLLLPVPLRLVCGSASVVKSWGKVAAGRGRRGRRRSRRGRGGRVCSTSGPAR